MTGPVAHVEAKDELSLVEGLLEAARLHGTPASVMALHTRMAEARAALDAHCVPGAR